MAIWRLMCSFATETGLSRDRVVINPVFNATSGIDDPQALCDEMATALDSWLGATYDTEITVRAYDVEKNPHGPAAGSATVNPGIYFDAMVPREIALCLSFYSTYNVKRQRGRVYVPAFLAQTTGLPVRPDTAIQTKVSALAQIFMDLGPADTDWSVYSTVDRVARKVTNWYVDNEWDIVRSRGGRPTSRVSGVTSE